MVQQDMQKKPKQKPRRSHSPEYKAEVVRLCKESNKSPEVIGREMGLSGRLVRRWISQARIDATGGSQGPLTTSEREELARLKKEVKHLRQERDILKRATAFFVKEATS
jgi:transposase